MLLYTVLFLLNNDDNIKDNFPETLSIEGANYDLVHGEISVSEEVNPLKDIYGYLVYILSSGFILPEN